jgi:RNA polymerase sigma factor (sigma-70 family)
LDRERTIDLRPAETLFLLGAAGGLSDLQLLERFASRRDEAAESAFGALVDRHGPMVMNVCRGVLRDEHEACDAFQATFLVLAQRAGSLWVRDSLGPWLHRVARRTASSARSAACRRRRREAIAAGRAARSYEDAPDDHREVVHEEVDRLPEPQRAPVVLCLLEGLTPEQAAQRLGWPAGTVRSRLARAKVRLKSRLERRGLHPTAMLATVRAGGPAPTALIHATTAAATRVAAGQATGLAASAGVAALVSGELRMTALRRIGMIAAGVLAIGVAATAAWSRGDKGNAPPQAAPGPAGARSSAPAPETPAAARCQVAFLGPTGLKVGWQVVGRTGAREFTAAPLEAPTRLGFGPGATYRLKLVDVPGRPAATLYPTLEIPPPSPATAAFLAHAEIPVQFTPEDFDQAYDGGGLVVKAIYLPDPAHQEVAVTGVETLVSTRVEPGVDPVREAAGRGAILAVVRLGRIVVEPKRPGPVPAPIDGVPPTLPPAGSATSRTEPRPTPPGAAPRADARPSALWGVRSPAEFVGHGV